MKLDSADDRYEVAVVGGGPAGAAATRVLASRGRSVALVEASTYDEWRLGETLSPDIIELLRTLGVAKRFEEIPKIRSNGIRSCWGEGAPHVRSFMTTPHGAGYHIDRAAFDRMLAEAAGEAGTKTMVGTRVTSCLFDASDRTFTLELEQFAAGEECSSTSPRTSIRADALLDATGRTASIARYLGGHREVTDRLVAAAARFRIDHKECGRYTLVEPVPDGWWYSAPLPGGRAVIIKFTDTDLLGPCRQRGPWRDALERTAETATRLDEATYEQGPNVATVLSHRLRRSLGRKRWLTVGDAAMCVDPLSGSGVKLAVDTGVRGALAMDAWLDGDRSQVEAYRQKLNNGFDAYRDRKREYYVLEERWPKRTFWRRRRESE